MKIFILFLLFSIIYPRRDCLQHSRLDALGRFQSRPTAQDSTLSPSGHFFIHYDTTNANFGRPPDMTDTDGNNIPDYIDEVAIIADSAYHVLVSIMGYNSEPLDSDGIYDIYIASFSTGYYGYCTHEGNGTSYIKLDNDYLGYNSNFGQTPLDMMRISLVHEYFHAIQYGYQTNFGSGPGSDAYFYEMTSMWIEDIVVPDGNDYLEDIWVNDLLENPEGDFDNRWPSCTAGINCVGEGYELALFGHYLSSYVDPLGFLDEKQSTIMKKIWEEYSDSYLSFSHYDKPLVVINRILQSEYQISFIDAWTDFMSRNLFNGLDENFYYYSDQVLIDPIQTLTILIDDSVRMELELDDQSVEIESYRIGDIKSRLSINHHQDNFIGRVAIISRTNQDNNIFFWSTDTTIIEDYSDVEIHFVYGLNNSPDAVSIDLVASSAPSPPSNLMAITAQDSIILSWSPSLGPGNNLIYTIYRNDDSLDVIQDTNYVDTHTIEGLIYYTYKITCVNNIGESYPSNSVSIQSWPTKHSVIGDDILSIYPNPIDKTNDYHILYALGSNYSNTFLELVNIKGQIINTLSLQSYQQGWHREKINKLISSELTSGIYFIRLCYNNIHGSTQKITILP